MLAMCENTHASGWSFLPAFTLTRRNTLKKSPIFLAAILGFLVPTAVAAPPLPPSASEVPSFDPRMSLKDLLGHTTFVPSALARAGLKADGSEFDPEAPVDFDAVPRAPIAAVADRIKLVDEILIFEGDTEIVTDFGNNRYGLSYDNQRQDPIRIAQRYFDNFGDSVDFIAVWTAFRDRGADGLAYYVPVLQDTFGLGEDRFDQRRVWGANSDGRFQGFLNMKSISTYGDISDPANFVYPVIGQELTHRWLAYFKMKRDDGVVSGALLGRDEAHWSSLMDADASVQDGNSWRDNGDGSFTVTENMARFSPLDLYGMGLYGPEEVAPFFLIEDGTYRGQAVSPASTLPVGLVVQGTRSEATIEDIIAANGARRPTVATSRKDFRMVFILVTAPGQTADDVQGQIEAIKTFKAVWEAKYTEWTYGRSTMCTRVSADCDRPKLVIASSTVREFEGDGDEMVSPGEKAKVSFSLQNLGGSLAEAARLHVVVPDDIDIVAINTPNRVGDIEAGQAVVVEDGITLEIGPDAPCGTDVRLKLEAATGELLTTGELILPIGYKYLFVDDFETDLGWRVNADGGDTAEAGSFERAVPQGVNTQGTGLNFQTQPAAGLAGGGKAWVTGAAAGEQMGANDVDGGSTSVTSPPISLAEARDPWVGYASWHTALDFNSVRNSVVSDDNDPLLVQISADEGQTWVLLEIDQSNEQQWSDKRFRILDLFPALPATITLRFTAMDDEPQSLTEAAVDRVRVWDLQDACYGSVVTPEEPVIEEPVIEEPVVPVDGEGPQTVQNVQGGGCGGGSSPLGAVPLALLGLWLGVRLTRRASRVI